MPSTGLPVEVVTLASRLLRSGDVQLAIMSKVWRRPSRISGRTVGQVCRPRSRSGAWPTRRGRGGRIVPRQRCIELYAGRRNPRRRRTRGPLSELLFPKRLSDTQENPNAAGPYHPACLRQPNAALAVSTAASAAAQSDAHPVIARYGIIHSVSGLANPPELSRRYRVIFEVSRTASDPTWVIQRSRGSSAS